MKYLLILITLSSYLFCVSEEDKSSIGVGGIYSESKYEGIDKETMVIPLFKYNHENFYIRGLEFGYKQIDLDTFKFNYILSPRLENYKSSDSSYLLGMEDRDMTLEAGVVLVYKPHPLLTLSSKLKTDILGVHNGYDLGFRVGSFLPLIEKKLFISPSYARVFLSSKLANYYYGVKASEATSTRAAYDVGSTSMEVYGVNFIYKLTDTINTNFMINRTILSQEIKDSPIIKDKNFNSLIVGLNYTF